MSIIATEIRHMPHGHTPGRDLLSYFSTIAVVTGVLPPHHSPAAASPGGRFFFLPNLPLRRMDARGMAADTGDTE